MVAGIVAFTWVFVNALPPAPNATTGGTLATTTTGPDDSGSTTTTEPVVASTTTTTAVPAEVVEFPLRADTVTGAADDLLVEAQEINETWESGRNFTLALNSLRDFDTRTGAFSDSVASASVPDSFATEWEAVQTAASDMAAAASDMVTGLQAPDTGQIRRAALADFAQATAELTLAVDAAKAAAEA